MLKLRNKIVLFSFLIFLLSCTTKKEKQITQTVERIEFKDNNKNRYYQGLLVNGKKEGLWIEYDDSCHVKTIKNFKNGVENGVYIQLKIDGTLCWIGNYKNGFRDGHWIGFQGNNFIRSEVFVQKEKFIGIGKHYDDNGFLYEEYDYDKDSLTKTFSIIKLKKRSPWSVQ